jgi:rhamnosyl/mannosyltransferase
MNKFLKGANCIVATSPNYVDSSSVLLRYKNKIKIIPIGIDDKYNNEIDTHRRNYWLEKFGNKFFLFVGVLRYYKGLDVLIDAIKESSCVVVIAGSGDLESKLKDSALKQNIHNVFFTGFITDKDKNILLSMCYAFVFPSHLRSEAFGISLLEAAMFGKALISCEIGTGTTYININNETGLSIDPQNPQSLKNALEYLWVNPQEVKNMGNNARKRYLKLFTSSTMAYEYFKLYQSLNDNIVKQEI